MMKIRVFGNVKTKPIQSQFLRLLPLLSVISAEAGIQNIRQSWIPYRACPERSRTGAE